MGNQLRVADLFCGAGGLSQGFIKAGCEIVFAIEYDTEIADAYQRNHPHTDLLPEDISYLDPQEVHSRYKNIDILIGGPPCQGFSQKGKRLNLNDPRNFLFHRFVDFVKEFKPSYFVLENVPNIITTSDGYFKAQIERAFQNLGYIVSSGVLCALNFGIPQDRRRAFFIGSRNGRTIALPKANGKRCTVAEAIYDLPLVLSGGGAETASYEKPPFTLYQMELRGSQTVLYNHVATNHSCKALAKLAMIPQGKGKEVLPKELLTRSIYSGTWCRLLEDGYAPTLTLPQASLGGSNTQAIGVRRPVGLDGAYFASGFRPSTFWQPLNISEERLV